MKKNKKNKYKMKVRSINVNQLFYLITSLTFQKLRSFETVNRFGAQCCHLLPEYNNRQDGHRSIADDHDDCATLAIVFCFPCATLHTHSLIIVINISLFYQLYTIQTLNGSKMTRDDHMKWFHGRLTREAADELLKQGAYCNGAKGTRPKQQMSV